jgi:hypothetical protein
MLFFLNALQLILYVALLSLVGQGLLFVLAGPRRDSNLFYQLLRIVARPFTGLVRRLTPARVADRHVPLLTFALLALVYLVVTFEKIDLCVRLGMEQCR